MRPISASGAMPNFQSQRVIPFDEREAQGLLVLAFSVQVTGSDKTRELGLSNVNLSVRNQGRGAMLISGAAPIPACPG